MVCLDETKKTMSEMAYRFSDKKFYNLDQAQERGLSSLLSRRNNSEVVYFNTDKSGRMSVDTLGNFIRKIVRSKNIVYPSRNKWVYPRPSKINFIDII